MIQLTTNLSDPLLELIGAGERLVDGVEVGPWFSVAQVRDYRRRFPELPFTFHGGNLIERMGVIPGTVSRIRSYQRHTGSPWVSMHLTMWWPGMGWLMLKWGWRMPLPHPERATRRFIRRVGRLARSIPVPVVLENVMPLPFPGYGFEVHAERVTQVLEQTGCGFLLDTGHARITAAALEMDVQDYLCQLPLERVVQIHVSGPRMRDGRLADVHESLEEIDYALLDFLLARTRPQVVTLEYIRESDPLREQLVRLRAMLDG